MFRQLLFIVAALSVSVYGVGQVSWEHPAAPSRRPILGRQPSISFHIAGVSGLQALLMLGREQHLPLGIRYADLTLVRKPISVSFTRVNLADVVGGILGQESGYTWKLSPEILRIDHVGAPKGPNNLLTSVIPDFTVQRTRLQDCSNLLYMDLRLVVFPGIRGFAGDYYPGRLESMVGPFRLHGFTVAEILDHIVQGYGEAAWVVAVPPRHLNQLPSRGLWVIFDYSDPASANAAQDIRDRLSQ